MALVGRAVFRATFLTAIVSVIAGCASEPPRAVKRQPSAVKIPVYLNELWLRNRPLVDAAFTQDVYEAGLVFDDPREVLKRVMRASHERPRVYPTEQYYYYRFPDGPRLVSGNIRFVDAERGAISVGYFDAHNPSDMKVAHFDTTQPGISIELSRGRGTVSVSVDDVHRVFVLDPFAFHAPGYPLYEGEQFISGVRDESGYYFHLIYHQPSRSFYYVLQPDQPLPEPLMRGGSEKIVTWFGAESRFCFIEHVPSRRRILVGVHRREIMENSWYDGPFDQVPPHLPIRDTLNEAYPYVEDAGGLDEHGNFLEREGQRVAISPYRNYISGPELEQELEKLIGVQPSPEAWIKATYEYKKDWRPPGPDTQAHTVEVSRSWPANHWGQSSRLWGEHEAVLSSTWPPNHEKALSSKDDPAEGN